MHLGQILCVKQMIHGLDLKLQTTTVPEIYVPGPRLVCLIVIDWYTCLCIMIKAVNSYHDCRINIYNTNCPCLILKIISDQALFLPFRPLDFFPVSTLFCRHHVQNTILPHLSPVPVVSALSLTRLQLPGINSLFLFIMLTATVPVLSNLT